MIRRTTLITAIATATLTAANAPAVNLVIDYSYDSSGFFGAGNPDGPTAGAQAKASLEAAATFLSGVLTDTFSAITTPPTFYSTASTGEVHFEWQATFRNPATGATAILNDPAIAADEYRIYAGSRSISGNTLGIGGAGGYGYSVTPFGTFSQSEINQLNQISDDFIDAITTRGEAFGFSSWGGSITFDNDASTNWNYDLTSSPSAGQSDFYSVALHELTHAMGFGSSAWEDLIAGTVFTGSASTALYGSNVPVETSDNAHWADGTDSTLYGSIFEQETAMDPSIFQGTRKRITELDVAGLQDIGWSTSLSFFDYDNDGALDVDDVDMLLAILPNDFYQPDFDADGNGINDQKDVEHWIENLYGTKEGDANLDGVVDLLDLSALASGFGTSSAGWSGGDFNADLTTDLLDLSILATRFGQTVHIPEPAAATLLFSLLGCHILSRRSRTSRASSSSLNQPVSRCH